MLATEKVEGRRRLVAFSFLALSLLAIIPIATVELPPILDYPNHMARMYLLAMLPSAADLAVNYHIAWAALPDLAFDAVVPWLARIMPVEIAMRLSLAAMLLAIAGGCVVLHRVAFRRWSAWPLFIFLLLYNRILLWGFLNYLAGLALMLWALALWIAMERKPIVWRILMGTIAATAIYLAHLAAFGCYALAIVAYSLAPRATERFTDIKRLQTAAASLVTLIPSGALFLAGATSGAAPHWEYGNLLRKFDLPVSIFDNYDRIFDGATFAVMLISITVGLVRRKIVLHDRLRWSLLAVLIAFVVLPSRLLSASGIDHRLPIAIAFLFVAAGDWEAITAKHRGIVTGLILILLLARMTVIETVWLHADREYSALRPIFDKIAPGASVAVAAPASEVQAGGVPLYHFPTLAVIERHAYVDTIFADPRQQPLRLNDAAGSLEAKYPPALLWRQTADGTLPPLVGFDDMIIVDPPSNIPPDTLPGAVLFTAPRMMLVHLNHTPAEPVQ